jgi:hypothetical protein
LIVGGLVLAGLIAVVAIRVHRHRALADRENVTVDQKHRQTRDAFSGNPPPVNGQDVRAISAALDRFNQALQRNDTAGLSRVFDADRLCDELDRLGAFAALSNSDRNVANATVNRMAPTAVMKQSKVLSWSAHQMKKIILSDNRQEAVVYDLETKAFSGEDVRVKVRWWVQKNGTEWKLWDFEGLESGMRASSLMASAMIAAGNLNGPQPPIALAAPHLRAAAAAVQQQDWKKAEASLKNLDGLKLPPEIDGAYKALAAVVHFRQSRFDEALKDCVAAEATGQDVPIVHEVRTRIYSALGRDEDLLQSAQKWEQALGSDCDMYYLIGDAQAKLKHPAEAAVAFGKSLDEEPDAGGSLAELSKVLPDGKKSEIARRFGLCKDPHAVFTASVPIVQRARDLQGMQMLLDAYRARRESAGDPWLTYYDAELKIIRRQYDQAEIQLKTLLPQATVAGQEIFESEYLHAARLAGHAVEAYGVASKPPAAFKLLAERMLGEEDRPMLIRLIALHLQRYPRDPWAHYYSALEHEDAGEYDAADKAFASAMSFGDAANADTYRHARVYARFKSGKGLSAYHDIAPSDKVFTQLSNLYSTSKEADNLSRLVMARRTDAANDPNLAVWDADAKFLAGRYADAIEVLKTHRETIEKDKSNHYRWLDMFVRSQVRLKNFAAARIEGKRAEVADKNLWQIAMVECAAGNVVRASEILDALLKNEDAEIGDFYADPDIGRALAMPAFANWRSRHPRPATQPATQPAAPNVD